MKGPKGAVSANQCPVPAHGQTTHGVLVGDGECARVVQVDQHALSPLEQLVRREGQAASQHADG
eukprot:5941244-Pleurochrysis_carterae.AAC.1